jgi:hypothetical protein
VEAYALFRDLSFGKPRARGRREIVSIGGADPEGDDATDAHVLQGIAIRVACQAGPLSVSVPKLSNEEVSFSLLESLGFRKGRSYTRYATVADSNTG